MRAEARHNKYYCQIAEKLVEKRDEPYSVMTSWIPRKISFLMMKSIIICIHGGRSIKHKREKASGSKVLAIQSEARCKHNVINKGKVMNNITPKIC